MGGSRLGVDKKDETDKKDGGAGHASGKWKQSIEKDAKALKQGRQGGGWLCYITPKWQPLNCGIIRILWHLSSELTCV